ncbi:hypothetical protein FVEN_g10241 [Fusarium venenatum]|uniref:Uncharacterized protein n=1 Tax=Fusarium venenatum TaxID=56646 RepID=A0A2L2TD04_9HYPO|nr:uncharacterized protein FVRRES_06703 [Fusarium venenatum]KAG8351606.1 hypothetical protein FVEN_g10241 [Fusarium venenatum]CEI62267.1 unnamed protein product [Fusarium venenatum]
MATRSKVSTMYWEANCLPPTIILPSQISDKPSSSSQTVSLTADALDQIKEQIKELMDLDKAPPDQDQKPPQQFVNPECKEPLVYPRYWKLWYSNGEEAQVQYPAPDVLPGRYRNPRRRPNDASQTAASCTCNTAESSPPEPNPKKQTTNRPQGFSLANRIRVKLWGPNKTEVLYPRYESDALLRQTGDQLDSVDQAHDKLKKSYVEFERDIRSAKDKEE